MNRHSGFVAALVFISFLATVAAQDEIRLEKHPGYIDLEGIRIPENAGKITDIILGPELLRIAALFRESSEDKTISKSIAGLLSIRVKAFEVNRDEDLAKLDPVVKKIQNKLIKDEWAPILQVKEGTNFTNLSIRYSEGKPVGLLLMSYEEPERVVTFINIVGGIRLEDISLFNLNIRGSALDSLRNAIRK